MYGGVSKDKGTVGQLIVRCLSMGDEESLIPFAKYIQKFSDAGAMVFEIYSQILMKILTQISHEPSRCRNEERDMRLNCFYFSIYRQN